MKQIRSGQSFLYRTNGYDSTVVEIRMHDKVTGSYLQAALTNTTRRFPYLTQKLVEKGGAYYLHRDDNSMVAVKTDKFRTLGSMATGYHLLDVTYTGNCIRVAFHHGLCDGRGVMPFIEAILYDYCCQKYHKKFSSDGIRLPGETIPEEETAEPFSREFYEVNEQAVQPVEHDGFALPESTSAPEALARRYRELLSAQREPNAVKAALNKQIGLFNKLDKLHTLEEKRQLMSFFNGMVNNTYVISYMGRLRLNDYAQYVESAHFSAIPSAA